MLTMVSEEQSSSIRSSRIWCCLWRGWSQSGIPEKDRMNILSRELLLKGKDQINMPVYSDFSCPFVN